jgi:ATP-dependent helicase YprA (DUF1998 family)
LSGLPLRLHTHQEEAIRVARQGRNYVLTTGTGSGKSLSYMIPIVDRVLREGSGKGIKLGLSGPNLTGSAARRIGRYPLRPRSEKHVPDRP